MEDMAALWLHLDNSVGVCFLERVLTRPKLSLRRSRMAIERGVDYMKTAARKMGYGAMFAYMHKGLARMATSNGFHRNQENLVSMICVLKEEN